MSETATAFRLDARPPDQTYKAEQVAALLGISRATFFRLEWFKSRKVRTSDGTVGYLGADVSLYQSLRRGR